MSPGRRKKRGRRKRLRQRRHRMVDRQPLRNEQVKAVTDVTPIESDRQMKGHVVSLDPLAPIIVRSGRPNNSHSDADPARFPPPSTIAGCLRTAWARETGQPFGPELAQLAVSGPLLAMDADRVLVPKPADALYIRHGASVKCVRAEPRRFELDCGADLPHGLIPVQLTEQLDGKPSSGPMWWSLEDLLEFRRAGGKCVVTFERLCERGWDPSGHSDRRTHVTIEPLTRSASRGGLFQTEGLDLGARINSDGTSTPAMRLLARVHNHPLRKALVHLGGKRRLATVRPEAENAWPAVPDGWANLVAQCRGLSLTLLTPAIFSAGYRPGWLGKDSSGYPPPVPDLKLELCAVAVERWQPHSGWDLANKRPRPTRKVAPSGSTYWFRILGDIPPDAIRRLWLTSVSDLDQDRRDGFGLALPGPWAPFY